MTTTKLPTDTELATPIGGKEVDPEIKAKLTDNKQRHKRDRFKALIIPRLKEAKYTENEAAAVIKFLENQVDELANVFLDPSKEFNAEPIQFDTTEYD